MSDFLKFILIVFIGLALVSVFAAFFEASANEDFCQIYRFSMVKDIPAYCIKYFMK